MTEELKAAQARIACLEGEIAKRDARIVELEADLAGTQSRVLVLQGQWRQLDAELAAIKAQEPCNWSDAQVLEFLGVALRNVDIVGSVRLSEIRQGFEHMRKLYAAPVSEAKAQEPDCDRSACGDFSPGPCDNPDCSARRDRTVVAPAAKAQGVALDGSQLAGLLEQVRLDDDEAKPHGSGATYWNNAVIACQVAIRDALAAPAQQDQAFCEYCGGNDEEPQDHCMDCTRPVQQVSVPDVSSMARILADRNADACNVNREDNWAIYGRDYIDDVTAMLAASPAAPAADAGLVEALEASNMLLRTKRHACENEQVCHVLDVHIKRNTEAIAAHRAKGVA